MSIYRITIRVASQQLSGKEIYANKAKKFVGLLMLTGIMGNTIACNRPKSDSAEKTTENVERRNSALKADSDYTAMTFKVRQAMQKVNSHLNVIKEKVVNDDGNVNNQDIKKLSDAAAKYSEALGEQKETMKHVEKIMNSIN